MSRNTQHTKKLLEKYDSDQLKYLELVKAYNIYEFFSNQDIKNLLYASREDTLCSYTAVISWDTFFVNYGIKPRFIYVLILRDIDHLKLIEIGTLINVSKERVRQIRTRAIKDLRHPKIHRALYTFKKIESEYKVCFQMGKNAVSIETKPNIKSVGFLGRLLKRVHNV